MMPTILCFASANGRIVRNPLSTPLAQQPSDPIRRQQRHLPELHERPVQQRRHPHTGAPSPPCTCSLLSSLARPGDRILPPRLLQLLHYEELQFRWRRGQICAVGVRWLQFVHVEGSRTWWWGWVPCCCSITPCSIRCVMKEVANFLVFRAELHPVSLAGFDEYRSHK